MDFGFRAVIATSFADIFHNNCFQNGLLPVVLPEDAVRELLDAARPDAATGRPRVADGHAPVGPSRGAVRDRSPPSASGC